MSSNQEVTESIESLKTLQQNIQLVIEKLDDLNKIDYDNLSDKEKMKLNNHIAYLYGVLEFCLSFQSMSIATNS